MANNHIISIEKEAKLSIDLGRLKILFVRDNEKHYFAPFDIAVLIIAHPCILLTSAVSKELSLAGAVIVYAGNDYIPVGMTLPVTINNDGARKPHLQAKYISNDKILGTWWQQVLKSKILGQALVLNEIGNEGYLRLTSLANKVTVGDKDNKEGLAAKFYWEVYFDKLNANVTERKKRGAQDVVNASLNYSYAIIRSMVARSLISSGLCLNFGIGHVRKDNPFNLVEDFIEPFRFVADRVVFRNLSSKYKALVPQLKRRLISEILATVVSINENNYRLFQAIDFAVNSFCLSLDDPRRKLLLPNIPIPRGAKRQIPENHSIKYAL